jgi:hypothetical protein
MPSDHASTPAATPDTLKLQVGELRQIFNAMDPAPFRERDLDPNAEAYIIDWAGETRRSRPLCLIVGLSGEPVTPESTAMLSDAVRTHFARRAKATRRQLRKLFRVGRISLVIGLAFLACAIAVGEFVASLIVAKENYGSFFKESLVIGGWVALWRPIEIFLYDWWPIRDKARLLDRLSDMQVQLVDATATGTGGRA